MNSIRSQIKSMLTVEPRPGGYRATLTVSPALSILPDHFPKTAILPGLCLIQAVLLAGATVAGVSNLKLVTLKNAKFVGPIFPGEQVMIDAEITRMAATPASLPQSGAGVAATAGDHFIIKAKVTGDGKKKAEFSLTARAEESAEEKVA